MMRSLWTAASGMTAQQTNIDTISNNLANVNNYGYKKERLEFRSLLYETMQKADLDPANQTGRPVNLQVGHGVRPIATSRMYTMGSLETTENKLDFAVEGDAFFTVQRGEGDIKYTRDGSFKASILEDGGWMLSTSEGYPVLNIDGDPIVLPPEVSVKNVNVADDGSLSYINANGDFEDLGITISLVTFSNVQGLEAIGSNLYGVTGASGQPVAQEDLEPIDRSRMIQGALEMSNVQVADEMVRMIVAQRAYELNSKAIQTSDDMLQTANNLKR